VSLSALLTMGGGLSLSLLVSAAGGSSSSLSLLLLKGGGSSSELDIPRYLLEPEWLRL